MSPTKRQTKRVRKPASTVLHASVTFDADMRKIVAGQTVQLYWNVSNVKAIKFNGGKERNDFSGGEQVAPEVSTVYQLTVQYLNGHWSNPFEVSIEVTPAPTPTPPPAPTPPPTAAPSEN